MRVSHGNWGMSGDQSHPGSATSVAVPWHACVGKSWAACGSENVHGRVPASTIENTACWFDVLTVMFAVRAGAKGLSATTNPRAPFGDSPVEVTHEAVLLARGRRQPGSVRPVRKLPNPPPRSKAALAGVSASEKLSPAWLTMSDW